MRLAFLERAYDSLAEPDGRPAASPGKAATPAGGLAAATAPAACALATWRLSALLGEGLAHEAVAMFRALPPALRERNETVGCETLPGGIDGVRLDDHRHADRLGLVAAMLLDGDAESARALLARVPASGSCRSCQGASRPGAAWHAGDPTGDPKGSGSDGEDPATVWRAVLERWLAGPAADDSFPLLAEFAETNLFGPGRTSYGVGLMVFARLADREGCPAISRYAWWQASRAADRAPAAPSPLPPAVVASARRLNGAIDERARLALMAHQAAAAAAPRERWPAASITLDGKPFDMQFITLLALDREGRHGIVFVENDPYFGEVYRLEASGGGLAATRGASWIS
jgi:hypothetical protein